MPIFSTMHLHRAFLCPYKRHFHSKAAIFPERSTIDLEFRASGVPLIGVLIANGKTQAVTDTKLEELTREVREHNSFARRMPVVEEQIKVINHRIADLEEEHR